MTIGRGLKQVLAILGLYLIFIVPAYFMTMSVAEAMAFMGFFAVTYGLFEFIKPLVVVGQYLNPLKIVHGRYGGINPRMSSSPLKGGLSALGIVVVIACSFNNLLAGGFYVF